MKYLYIELKTNPNDQFNSTVLEPLKEGTEKEILELLHENGICAATISKLQRCLNVYL